jgi:hypothetical protein
MVYSDSFNQQRYNSRSECILYRGCLVDGRRYPIHAGLSFGPPDSSKWRRTNGRLPPTVVQRLDSSVAMTAEDVQDALDSGSNTSQLLSLSPPEHCPACGSHTVLDDLSRNGNKTKQMAVQWDKYCNVEDLNCYALPEP